MDVFKGMIQQPICWSDRMVTERAGGKMGEVWRRIYLGGNPLTLSYLPGGGLPLPLHPLPPFTQLSLTRDRRLPLAAEPQKWYNCRNAISFHLGDFARVLGSFRFQEDTDFINERPKQETKGVGNHSYWQQGRKGLNDWDRWRKVLIWFHKLPLRQLDYNSSTAVAAIFQKMEITNLSSAAFSWVVVPSFLVP